MLEIPPGSNLLTIASGSVYGAVCAAICALLVLSIVCWQEFRLRKIRRALTLATRAKQDFLANVNHEIRTPLNAIQGAAELMTRSGLSADQRELTAVILANCENLVAVVNEILDTSRVEVGELRVEEVPFDLKAAVDAVSERIVRRAQAKGLMFTVAVRPGVPRHTMGDPQRLRQVLTYLLDNAVKFTEAGGVRLEVSTVGKPAAALQFRVVDTGPGMDPDLAEELLMPFAQADSTSSRKYGGVGLGLTLVHRLVVLMGGSVGVETQLGAGSTFWFLLPVRPVEAEARDLPHTGRILIVDDNSINQMVAARAVHNLGYTSQVVSGGAAAVEAVTESVFDLVLMDCQMPEVDGYQATRLIRERKSTSLWEPYLPIVAMTANVAPGDRERCIEAGMDDYLTKPVRMAVLARTLEAWIPAQGPKSEAPGVAPPIPSPAPGD